LVFEKNQSYDQKFASFSFVLSKRPIFGENILKIITLVPVSADFPAKIYSIDIAIHYEKDL
jgi:hypothetical protein